MPDQDPGDGPTDVADPEGGEEPGHRSVLGGLDRPPQVVHRDLAPALTTQQLVGVEDEDVGRVGDQTLAQQEIDGLVAHVLDVHPTPGAEVEQPLPDP